MANKKPIHEIRSGNVRACIWENVGMRGTFYSITFQRLYRDGDAWKSSPAFSARDTIRLMAAANGCNTWIHSRKREEDAAAGDGASKEGEGGE